VGNGEPVYTIKDYREIFSEGPIKLVGNMSKDGHRFYPKAFEYSYGGVRAKFSLDDTSLLHLKDAIQDNFSDKLSLVLWTRFEDLPLIINEVIERDYQRIYQWRLNRGK
jgi:hypothetical protein